jgi:ribose transport system ATP-binding protein
MDESILEFEKIEKSFSGVPALRGISFALQTGHILGLAGENGAGKSTAMNILGGIIRADAGAIRYSGRDYRAANPADAIRQGIAFIHQELNLFPNLSIAENFFIAAFPSKRLALIPWIDRKEMRCKSQVMLDAVELSLSPDMLVEKLSQGERQLGEIAKALSSNARLIILDEPTTSLTTREAERLFGLMARLKAQGISMIYISHNLEDVLRLCDEVLVLRDGAMVASGSREEFTKEKIISRMVGRETAEKLRALIEKSYFPLSEKLPFGRVTMSVGVACYPDDAKNEEELIRLADQALYRAKKEGRNRTVTT